MCKDCLNRVALQVIHAAQQRYAADERVQLDTVADHFVSVFRDAELPFNKLLAEQPLPKVCTTPCLQIQAVNLKALHSQSLRSKTTLRCSNACASSSSQTPFIQVAKTPADAVPGDVTQAMSAFLAAKDAAAVAAFAGALIDAAFEGVPEAVGSSKAPPKANVSLAAR